MRRATLCNLPSVPMLPGFLSTLSLRRATGQGHAFAPPVSISIHALLAESDANAACIFVYDRDFYPRSPCGERLNSFPIVKCDINFYPRSPCGERQQSRGSYIRTEKFLSTLSLRRATDTAPVTGGGVTISIHALLAESDVRNIYAVHWFSTFLSTLSLRRATRAFCWALPSKLFLSTLSLRRATPRRKRLFHRCAISIHALLAESDTWYNAQKDKQKYFYPRSPCGERPADRCGASCRFLFLSTLSLRRATCNMHSLRYCCTNFYPRSPCGERPINALLFLLALNISIHALLAESDGTGADRGWPVPHFYPRSPCGERHVFIVGVAAGVRFLSTLSLRRATLAGQKLVKADTGISIHALLAESDELLAERFGNTLISIHALLAESDGRVKSL